LYESSGAICHKMAKVVVGKEATAAAVNKKTHG
jgi:hypothetical protein